MTCKEKLAADRPYLTEVELGYIIKEACPDTYGYLPEPSYCMPRSDECKRCWDREISEKKEPTVEDLLLYGRKVLDDFVNGFMNRKD